MRGIAGITLILCLAAPLFAQTVDGPVQRPEKIPANVLTKEEVLHFQRQIGACWLVTESDVSVTLGFALKLNGRPITKSLTLLDHTAANSEAVTQAFALAKRAVMRCGRDGYKLPVEKYEYWRNIEITFDPERTILK